ncbi:hypothetical protein [Dysgonomonas macrotermitis]|uniref:Uncharacterized protein n=1 Tax=Dysgonomonas macrotermitis TaxID=1346286 RepID=A0A1M5J4G8_9BACT|nr:hypothetical protein [Dysgonomonas macrotermitis]SHG35411.1 hypothetical protein SAMN05444362_1224 [Dysgonomonas macrotermitis]
MKQIFEQLTFIPKMVNTSSKKVQECGIWSAVYSLLMRYRQDKKHTEYFRGSSRWYCREEDTFGNK